MYCPNIVWAHVGIICLHFPTMCFLLKLSKSLIQQLKKWHFRISCLKDLLIIAKFRDLLCAECSAWILQHPSCPPMGKTTLFSQTSVTVPWCFLRLSGPFGFWLSLLSLPSSNSERESTPGFCPRPQAFFRLWSPPPSPLLIRDQLLALGPRQQSQPHPSWVWFPVLLTSWTFALEH